MFSGLCTMRGARSLNFLSRRCSQRSAGSVTWESAEISFTSAMVRLPLKWWYRKPVVVGR